MADGGKKTGQRATPNRRPVGVTVAAALLVIKGLVSLALALDLFTLARAVNLHGSELAVGVQVATGLLLLGRAYGLLSLHFVSWLATVFLLAIDGAASVGALILGARTTFVWASLLLAVGIEWYLFQPRVREMFR